jgi:hypothetical protein
MDQVDEPGPERSKRLTDLGSQDADGDAENHRDDHRESLRSPLWKSAACGRIPGVGSYRSEAATQEEDDVSEDLSQDVSQDRDPAETQEWVDALDSLLAYEGTERAFQLLDEVLSEARRKGAAVPYGATTPT